MRNFYPLKKAKVQVLPLLVFLCFCIQLQAQYPPQTPITTNVDYAIQGYYEWLPSDYASQPKKKYPLLIFLHGIGEVGNGSPSQLPQVLVNGPPKLINQKLFPTSFLVNGQSYSFIVLSPQMNSNARDPQVVQDLIDYASKRYRVDPDRIYLTGLSMGGGIAWLYVGSKGKFANTLAAFAEVCGNTMAFPSSVKTIAKADLPVKGFHNSGDPIVPVSYSINWINQLNAASINPPALLTVFNANSHDAWSKAYDPNYRENGMNVYEWMLQYTRGGKQPPPPPPPPPPVNTPPIANAGTDQTISLPSNSVTVNGASSSDPDGGISVYNWTQVSGPTIASITSPFSAQTTIRNLVQGTYTFLLTVVDNKGLPATDQMVITVQPEANQPPVANAGADQIITLPTNSVYLNGTASVDPNGSISSYAWSQISGPSAATIGSPASVITQVTALQVGSYVFKLTIKDGGGASDADSLTVVVKAPLNTPPVADAGIDQLINLPTNSVTLDGAKSKDPDGSIASYQWAQIAGPAASSLANQNASSTQVNGLVVGQYTFELTVTDNLGSVAKDQVKVTVAAALNTPPVASAGSNQTITLPTNSVTLSGAGSTDADGNIAAYLWSQLSGPSPATLVDTNKTSTSATGLVTGQYIFELTVTDNKGATGKAQVKITVNAATNLAPVANAGSSKAIILPINTISLDGSASADADGSIVSYSWVQVSGPSAATLANAGSVTGTASNLIIGQYVFELTVTDNKGANGKAQVKVTVSAAANQLPVANAGADQSITLPVNAVALNGSASYDPNGVLAGYSWTQSSGPSTASLSGANTTNANASGLVKGVYVFKLVVTDDKGATATDYATITVNAALNKAPVANAGVNITITLPTNSVIVDGSSSTDADGSIASYSWTQQSGPAGASISDALSARPTLSGLVQGTYTFLLAVTDNQGATATDQVVITVQPDVNQPPVANAGTDQNITLPTNSIQLNGSSSVDPNGSISSYAWSQISGPSSATIGSPASVITQVSALQVGSYVFKLTVKDGNGASDADSLTVVVKAPLNAPPVADAGIDQFINLPANSVTLDGAKSKDPDGSIASYHWAQIAGPAASSLANQNASSTQVNGLVSGQYIFELTVTDNLGSAAKDQVKVTVAAALNTPPVASAGSNQTITLPTNSVSLSGTGSTDADGNIAAYLWAQISGPSSATLTKAGSVTETASDLVIGQYVFELTVTDNKGATGKAQVKITVNAATNLAPVANAGTSKAIILPINTITLDGSASTDADGSIVGYSWAQISGPSSATLANAGSVTGTASDLIIGQYVFELTVTDNKGATGKAQVKITVSAAGNQLPVANAGADQSITLPANAVTLNGSASYDPSGVLTGYSWTQSSGPSTASLSGANTANANASGLVKGVYVFKLVVSDDKSATATDYATITVNAAANQAPVANAGVNITITLPTNSVTLDGSSSTDADGSIASYSWTQQSGPAAAGISDASTARPTISGLVQGTYTFNMLITDNAGATASDNVTVTVNALGNRPPVALAGENQTITLPANSVTLDGSASYDPDGNLSSFAWSQVSGPSSALIASPDHPSTQVTTLVRGTYVFKLKVSDSQGAFSEDQLTVTVMGETNLAPVANAGTSLTITLPASNFALDGSKSSDPDGTIVTYHWSQISGPSSASFNNAFNVSPVISNLVIGQYIFRLTVTDNDGVSSYADVKISAILAPNQAPIANAGHDAIITLPLSSITLDGSRSFDPDGHIVKYSWTKLQGPDPIDITGSETAIAEVSGLQPGQYTFELVVWDEKGATGLDIIYVNVIGSSPIADPNLPPIADAGHDTTVQITANNVWLDASASFDPDGQIFSYAWTQMDGPSAADIVSSASVQTMVSGLQTGNYTFLLTVTDNQGATDTASVHVTVNNNERYTEQVVLFPNPAQDITNFKLTSDSNGRVRINIYDLTGKLVKVMELEKTAPYLVAPINVVGLAKGMYTVQFIIGTNRRIVTKLIKQ